MLSRYEMFVLHCWCIIDEQCHRVTTTITALMKTEKHDEKVEEEAFDDTMMVFNVFMLC